MHPAYSVIGFTTLSGAGYGLLAALALAAAHDLPGDQHLLAILGMLLSLSFITAGLLLSTQHLGHPERAWQAFSQWRSSWLSREGVAAVFTYVPAVLMGAAWILTGRVEGSWIWLAWLTACGAAATVFCTGKIYASLKTIRQWHHPYVVPLYLAFAAATGLLWATALLQVFGAPTGGLVIFTGTALLCAWGLKLAYWRSLRDTPQQSDLGSATGLGGLGEVRVLDLPHTETNYLQQEMGFRIARKHADRLRRIAVALGAALPLALLAFSAFATQPLAASAMILAALSGMLGTAIERWLFFAEAEHSVMLYYGM